MMCLCRTVDFVSPDHTEEADRRADATPSHRPGQVQTWLAHRTLFDRIGVFNTDAKFDFSEGSELYSRVESAGLPIVRIDDLLVERRLHATNKTRDANAHMDGIMALMQQRIAQRRARS